MMRLEKVRPATKSWNVEGGFIHVLWRGHPTVSTAAGMAALLLGSLSLVQAKVSNSFIRCHFPVIELPGRPEPIRKHFSKMQQQGKSAVGASTRSLRQVRAYVNGANIGDGEYALLISTNYKARPGADGTDNHPVKGLFSLTRNENGVLDDKSLEYFMYNTMPEAGRPSHDQFRDIYRSNMDIVIDESILKLPVFDGLHLNGARNVKVKLADGRLRPLRDAAGTGGKLTRVVELESGRGHNFGIRAGRGNVLGQIQRLKTARFRASKVKLLSLVDENNTIYGMSRLAPERRIDFGLKAPVQDALFQALRTNGTGTTFIMAHLEGAKMVVRDRDGVARGIFYVNDVLNFAERENLSIGIIGCGSGAQSDLGIVQTPLIYSLDVISAFSRAANSRSPYEFFTNLSSDRMSIVITEAVVRNAQRMARLEDHRVRFASTTLVQVTGGETAPGRQRLIVRAPIVRGFRVDQLAPVQGMIYLNVRYPQ